MSLLKYLKKSTAILPTPEQAGIGRRETEEADKRVEMILGSSTHNVTTRKRKATSYSAETRVKIGKYAAINGTAAARKHFREDMGDLPESTVRKFKNLYTSELLASAKRSEYSDVTALPPKKRGRPLAMGEILDNDVQKYIRALRLAGTAVSVALVQAAGEGIVMAKDRTLLVENGGHISITRGWADSLLKRMGYVKRKATTKTSILSDKQLKRRRAGFCSRFQGWSGNMKYQTFSNWDQTGIKLVPWTLEEQGTRRVEIAGINDKRMITATFTSTLSGHFLPMQVLYTGKTSRCHPHFSEFPPGFDIWHSPNHWANTETSVRFVNNVIIPYVTRTQTEHELSPNYPALVIFDVFRGQTVNEVYELLEEYRIFVVLVPSNCTDKLQPMDLSVNKSAKDYLRKQFHTWYAAKVKDQLESGKNPDEVCVDVKMTVIKEVGVRWLVSLY